LGGLLALLLGLENLGALGALVSDSGDEGSLRGINRLLGPGKNGHLDS
jgi:hypothetical protein